MTTIPGDIVNAAKAAIDRLHDSEFGYEETNTTIIARTLLAERERCAAEIAALKAQLAQEQDDNAEMLLIAHLNGAADAKDAIKALKAENERLRKAALAYQELSVCYRVGKRPSEKLFTALRKAEQALNPTTKENG